MQQKKLNKLDLIIREAIVDAIKRNNFMLSRAARDLGISRGTMYSYKKKYQIKINRSSSIVNLD